MKQILVLLLALLCPNLLFAQKATSIKGQVISSESKQPIEGVIIALTSVNRQALTNEKGEFTFENVKAGKEIININSVNIIHSSLPIMIVENSINDIGQIEVKKLISTEDVSLLGVIDESLIDDDTESSSQEISSKVIFSNDVYLNKVSYQLSQMRFRVRGYDSNYEKKYINGVNFNDQLRGIFNYSSIGALNDMTRNGNVVNYNDASNFAYGSIGGMENINMRASEFSGEKKATLSYTNRNYYLRGMATYSTGLLDNGWAFAASIGGRYSNEGVIDGTYYNNFSYALSAEKQWNNGKHSLSVVTFGSPVNKASQGASYQEAYNLTGNNLYNPNWGYQNGEKRSAKIVNSFDPTMIISHIWKINENNTLTTGIGTHYGLYGSTALNWYDAPDPRPDYYRNLPSYLSDEIMINEKADMWRSNNPSITQLNWDKFYLANSLQKDGSALYMLEERHSDLFETTFNTTLNSRLSNNNKLSAGIELRSSKSMQYKTANDLLGASYVMDYDKYAERDFHGDRDKIQNDLNRPDRKVYKDGIFGYDFDLNITKGTLWANNQYNFSKVDLYYGAKIDYTEFYRDGKMKNGRYPESSFGKGETHKFVDMNVKAGFNYKINGRHFITANIGYGTEAPLANDAYISPRISDKSVKDLKSGRVLNMDINYIFSMQYLKGRISLFQTNFYDQIERTGYYDDYQSTFVNHVLTGVNRINRGIEIGTTYKVNNQLSFDLAGTVSEYYYNNNPNGIINSENGKIDNVEEKVYMKNIYVGGMPQFGGTFGIRYFINYWFLGANLNAFGRNYIEVSPGRRLASKYTEVNPSKPETIEAYNILTSQERFNSAMTVDLSIGKLFYINRKNSINFNLSVSNLLNNKNIRTGGFEQGRMDINRPNVFASKYYYMQGINCFVNLGYKF